MKIVKLGIISVVGLFLLMTAMAALLPSQVIISRVIDINRPLDSVYGIVNNLHSWPTWVETIDSAQYDLTSKTSGPGASTKQTQFRSQLKIPPIVAYLQSGRQVKTDRFQVHSISFRPAGERK